MKKIFMFFLISICKNYQNTLYLHGNALNTKAVSNAEGTNFSETTTHSLDDVGQSKAYSYGDNESNARTSG